MQEFSSFARKKKIMTKTGHRIVICAATSSNGRLAILKNSTCLQLMKELNNKKDRIKLSHYVHV